MARILLIEQQVIVREAIRHFLFPEHMVMATEVWPTTEELVAHDAAIIDTVSLSRMGLDQKETETLLAQANISALWLSPEDAELPEPNAACIFIRKPLEANVLASALDDLLRAPLESNTIIELTEIVEELPDEAAKSK